MRGGKATEASHMLDLPITGDVELPRAQAAQPSRIRHKDENLVSKTSYLVVVAGRFSDEAVL
jgi:hypothetical protein